MTDPVPLTFDDGQLAVFGIGWEDPRGAFESVIAVAVGTPASGASLLAAGIAARIHGSTLDELQAAFLVEVSGAAGPAQEIAVDGEVARRLRFERSAGRSDLAVLALHADRSFVIMALGFPRAVGWPPRPDLAESAVDAFLRRFHFGPGLFVSRELGFQVDLPVDERPVGATASSSRRARTGIFSFSDGDRLADGEYTHVIGVSVGTADAPAFVRNVPSGLPQPATRRLWAPTLADLVRAYRRLVDPGDGLTVPATLDGEPAMLVLRADGVAATLLAVHDGRVHVISTTGRSVVERAPHFARFLASFAFLD